MEDQHFSTQSSTQPRKHKNEINALLFQHSNGVAEAKGLSDHFSAEELSAFEVFITDLDKMESETSESQLQYVVWVELRFLSDDQKQWLRKYEPVLWITLHSTKIGCSSSKELLFQKMAKLQLYIPFGILHFEALLCVDTSTSNIGNLMLVENGSYYHGMREMSVLLYFQTSLQETSFLDILYLQDFKIRMCPIRIKE